MAKLGHARRHTTFAAITSVAAAALLSPVALVSAWVYAESLPLQAYSTAVGKGQVTVGTALIGEGQLARISPDGIRLLGAGGAN